MKDIFYNQPNKEKNGVSSPSFAEDLGAKIIAFFAFFGRHLFSPLLNALRHMCLYVLGKAKRTFLFLKSGINGFFESTKSFFSRIKTVREHIRSETDGADESGDGAKEHAGNNKKIRRAVSYVFGTKKGAGRKTGALVALFASVLLAASFFTGLSGLTPALKVKAGDKTLGYISDEMRYVEVLNNAKARLYGGELKDVSCLAVLVKPSKISDVPTLTNRLLMSVAKGAKNCCGIYVNSRFVCAVDRENTFERAKEKVLDDYAKKHGIEKKDGTLSFYDDVETKSGVYMTNERFFNFERLCEYLSGEKIKQETYILKDGESLSDVLKIKNKTADELKKLNPKKELDSLKAGDSVIVRRAEPNVRIKLVKTYVLEEEIPYSTVRKNDPFMSIGFQKTIVQGESGRDAVTYKDTYIDGELVSSKLETLRYNVKRKVNSLVRIGINTENVIASDPSRAAWELEKLLGTGSPRLLKVQGGKFLWPAPDNCFYLSQGFDPYGNNHYGIDIISSDSGICRGRRICAVADGVVTFVGYYGTWGNYVKVDHGDGVVTGYAHALDGSFRVRVGDYVKAGQQLSSIGTTGRSTGYHLHFEVWLDGERVNPLPYIYDDYSGAYAAY